MTERESYFTVYCDIGIYFIVFLINAASHHHAMPPPIKEKMLTLRYTNLYSRW